MPRRRATVRPDTTPWPIPFDVVVAIESVEQAANAGRGAVDCAIDLDRAIAIALGHDLTTPAEVRPWALDALARMKSDVEFFEMRRQFASEVYSRADRDLAAMLRRARRVPRVKDTPDARAAAKGRAAARERARTVFDRPVVAAAHRRGRINTIKVMLQLLRDEGFKTRTEDLNTALHDIPSARRDGRSWSVNRADLLVWRRNFVVEMRE